MLTSVRRRLSRLFEWSSTRPLSIIVFAASVALLVTLQSSQVGRFHARAVAEARVVEHPALVSSFVSAVHVRAGDRVDPGAPLAELSSYFLERELAQVEAETERLLHEAKLAQAQLVVEEERWLDARLRQQPNRPSLRRHTDAVYGAQLEALRTRRLQLLEDREHLTVLSTASGRVGSVLAPGSSVAQGTSIATVIPEYAEEIVAYVSAETDPTLIAPGTRAQLLDSQMVACRGAGTVQRRGSSVVQAPAQLDGFLRRPVHGMPVYISVPDGCELGVGQVLAVEFPKAGG